MDSPSFCQFQMFDNSLTIFSDQSAGITNIIPLLEIVTILTLRVDILFIKPHRHMLSLYKMPRVSFLPWNRAATAYAVDNTVVVRIPHTDELREPLIC